MDFFELSHLVLLQSLCNVRRDLRLVFHFQSVVVLLRVRIQLRENRCHRKLFRAVHSAIQLDHDFLGGPQHLCLLHHQGVMLALNLDEWQAHLLVAKLHDASQ